jgi:hypothetical protein
MRMTQEQARAQIRAQLAQQLPHLFTKTQPAEVVKPKTLIAAAEEAAAAEEGYAVVNRRVTNDEPRRVNLCAQGKPLE